MPESAFTGSGARKDASVPGYTAVSPRGFRVSEAILATAFEVPMPMEQVTPSSSTRCWMRCATSTGCSRLVLVGLTSAKASSMLTCWMSGVSS